jgi:hypothetical protein
MDHDLLVAYSEAKVKDMTLEEFEKIQQENMMINMQSTTKMTKSQSNYAW